MRLSAVVFLSAAVACYLIILTEAAVSTASLNKAAAVFSANLGRSAGLNKPVSKKFENACLGINQPFHHSITPIIPRPRPSPPVKRPHQLSNRDIVFVLDSSGSIPSIQFEKAKKAINILIEYLCPTTFGNQVTYYGKKQISVVTFSTNVRTDVDFSESSKGLGYLQDKILSINHQRRSTATGNALRHVRTQVLGKGSSRLNHSQVSTDVIVITDGRCNVNCGILGAEANAIRKMGHGVNLFALSVGNVRPCELEIITGHGTKLDLDLEDFTTFERFAEEVKKIALASPKTCA